MNYLGWVVKGVRRAPKGVSFFSVLIHVNRVQESVLERDYSAEIIDFIEALS